MTRYDTGRETEYLVRNELALHGYHVVRSAGSKGAVDLVATWKKRIINAYHPTQLGVEELLFVQVKRGGVLPPGEWNDLFDLCEQTGAVPVLAEKLLRKPVQYFRLTDRKEGRRGRSQPREPFILLPVRHDPDAMSRGLSTCGHGCMIIMPSIEAVDDCPIHAGG